MGHYVSRSVSYRTVDYAMLVQEHDIGAVLRPYQRQVRENGRVICNAEGQGQTDTVQSRFRQHNKKRFTGDVRVGVGRPPIYNL
jgi:ketopantoate reductase